MESWGEGLTRVWAGHPSWYLLWIGTTDGGTMNATAEMQSRSPLSLVDYGQRRNVKV